jgi:mRNA-degrading endonuclease YafQ of YafQ-DinJ toxin-antitoxin module
MIKVVRITRRAEKSLECAPLIVRNSADFWRRVVEEHGIEAAQEVPGFRDHGLKGKLRKSGIRSVSLCYSFRLYYRVVFQEVIFVSVEEVNHHDYKKVERLFGG